MDHRLKPRKDKRGVDLISDALPFGRLWYDGPNAASNAIGYASSTAAHMVRNSRLRLGGQRDRNARARGRFPRSVLSAWDFQA